MEQASRILLGCPQFRCLAAKSVNSFLRSTLERYDTTGMGRRFELADFS
jgi:hypothetical protein